MAKKREEEFYSEESTLVEEKGTEAVRPLAEEETMEPITKNGTVCNSDFVRVRKAASGTSEVLATLTRGEKVEILDVEDGFKKIRFYGNEIGYISSNFCKED